jgi:hypothetical protein
VFCPLHPTPFLRPTLFLLASRAGEGGVSGGVGGGVRQAASARCQHTSAYVSIRQHTSAYVSIHQAASARCQHTSAYVSIRQHTSAYVSIRLEALAEEYTKRLQRAELVFCFHFFFLRYQCPRTHIYRGALISQANRTHRQ